MSRIKLLLPAAMLLAVGIACDLSLAEELAEGIDTTPTDCEAPAFVVTTEEDLADGACNSHCTLREAVIAANTCEGRDFIELPAGTYTLSLRGGGADRGDLDIWDDLQIVGEGEPGSTIIQGEPGFNDRVFDILSSINVTLENLTVQGGNAGLDVGGGIKNRANFQMVNVIIQDNRAWYGGGLYNRGLTQLTNVTVRRNIATFEYSPDWRGGDWFNYTRYPSEHAIDKCGGGITNTWRMTLIRSEVSENRAAIGAGICQHDNPTDWGTQIVESTIRNNGGLDGEANPDTNGTVFGGGVASFGPVLVRDSIIEGNQAATGGGLYLSSNGHGSISLLGSSVVDNQALLLMVDTGRHRGSVPFHASGGGIHVNSGDMHVYDSVIADNQSQYFGGGVAVEGLPSAADTRVNIWESALVRNAAELNWEGASNGYGGGLHVRRGSTASIILRNLTISSNSAKRGGDGVHLDGGRSIALQHVTLMDNRDASGATGLLSTAPDLEVRIGQSLLGWHDGNACAGLGNVISGHHNLVPAGQCIADRNLMPTDQAVTEPGELFVLPLTEVDGSWVHPIPPASAAYDYIPEDECWASGGVDQLLVERPLGEGCEIGAYETAFGATSANLPTPLPGATATPTQSAAQPDPETPPFVVTDTLCWKGPGPLYEVVSSLAAGTEVQILGRGVEGDWWVIDNPRYQGVRCWAPGEDIEVTPNYDYPSTLFEIPPLPTPTPTPILGCLYQGPNDNQAVCYPINQCPVDFEDSQGACTP